MPKKRITIGIPCYRDVPGETLEDYMRFAYYLGRRYTEYDFYLVVHPGTFKEEGLRYVILPTSPGSSRRFFLWWSEGRAGIFTQTHTHTSDEEVPLGG